MKTKMREADGTSPRSVWTFVLKNGTSASKVYHYFLSITPDFDFLKMLAKQGFSFIYWFPSKMLWNLAHEQDVSEK